MKRLYVALVAVMAIACGGNSTPTTPTPTPVAKFSASAQINSDCTFAGASTFCAFTMTATNTGTGCGKNVRATVKFFDANNAQVATGLFSTDPAALAVQPGQAVTMTGTSTDYGMRNAKTSTTTFTFDACQ